MMKIALTVLFVAMCIVSVMYLQLKKETTKIKDIVELLVEKNKQLKAKVRVCDLNASSICHAGDDYQGEVRYIDCGDSFMERWATCLCTTMCLEDFTITVTNRQRCRNWPSVPIQIRPEPAEDEDDEDDEEDE
jgi:hypothetical protein